MYSLVTCYIDLLNSCTVAVAKGNDKQITSDKPALTLTKRYMTYYFKCTFEVGCQLEAGRVLLPGVWGEARKCLAAVTRQDLTPSRPDPNTTINVCNCCQFAQLV